MVDENTRAIVAMAWARSFGLGDDAFSRADGPERWMIEDAGSAITVLQLAGRAVVVAPQWALEAAGDYTDDVLVSVPGLLDLAKDHQPSETQVHALLYADDYLSAPGMDDAEVTVDSAALTELLPSCAPDDVHGSGAQTAEHQLVLLGQDRRPTAAAGYSTQHAILADLTFVQAIDARGTGAVEIAAALAMHDALDAGLVPQLRLGVDDDRTTAHALGFEQLGILARVALGA